MRAALPQDEFLRSDQLSTRSSATRRSTSCSRSRRRPSGRRSTPASTATRALRTVLTGYLDEARWRASSDPREEARAARRRLLPRLPAPPYLGRHGMLKTAIADVGPRRGARPRPGVDVSTRAEDTLYGDDWFRLLAAAATPSASRAARASSIATARSALRPRRTSPTTRARLREFEAACFPGRDGELSLFAISPRHLEACATRTGQILVEGGYSGVLEAGVHYLALERISPTSTRCSTQRQGRAAGGDHRARVPRRRGLRPVHPIASGRGRRTRAAGRPARRRGLAARCVIAAAALVARIYDELSWLRVARRLRGIGRLFPAAPHAMKTIVSITPRCRSSATRARSSRRPA